MDCDLGAARDCLVVVVQVLIIHLWLPASALPANRSTRLLAYRSYIDGNVLEVIQIDQKRVLREKIADILRRIGCHTELSQQLLQSLHLSEQKREGRTLRFPLPSTPHPHLPPPPPRATR